MNWNSAFLKFPRMGVDIEVVCENALTGTRRVVKAQLKPTKHGGTFWEMENGNKNEIVLYWRYI